MKDNGGGGDDDDDEGFHRVPPMALVRCSRGGKTRALTEVAKQIVDKQIADCVIFVTLNDWSSISPAEQSDPLAALCRRIAFTVSKDVRPCGPEFQKFLSRDFVIEPDSIIEWLDDTSAVLLVDELNNLSELAIEDSDAATTFGNFVKTHFLDKKDRYFVFSTHVLDTLEFFAHHVDPGRRSTRPVILQELPVVTDLSTALQLKSNLNGPREAIYYGLVPAMIYERAMSRNIEGKRV